MANTGKMVYTFIVEIVAASLDEAEALRAEMVGAAEDNAESRRLDAEAFSSPLDDGRLELRETRDNEQNRNRRRHRAADTNR